MLLNFQRSYNSSTTLKVSLETIIALNSAIMDCIVASHQQSRETRSPVVQVSASQRANAPLDFVRHVFVVVLLVPQCAQEVEEAIARVLSLLA